MASSEEVSIEDAPASCYNKSGVWRHFGHPVLKKSGNSVPDRTRTICKVCKKLFDYTAANTRCMRRHLQNQHRALLDQNQHTGPVKRPHVTNRAAEITRHLGMFIATDLTPFCVVDSVGFRRLVHALEPNYCIPTRAHFSRTVVPSLYEECRARVLRLLKDAESVAMTTDVWMLRGVSSYVTVTAHALSSAWDVVAVVLLTRPLSGANMAEVLLQAVSQWELRNRAVAMVTDDVRDTEVAALREAGLQPCIQSFSHAVTRATQAGLGVTRVSALLGRVRQVVGVFHESAAAAVLKSKQKLLHLPCHELRMDASTRWTSTLDMLGLYLQQQDAIAAALPDLTLHTRIKVMSSSDVQDTRDLKRLLDALKMAVTLLCEDKNPPVSLIVPLSSMIQQSMSPNHDDSATVADMKSAVLSNMSGSYSGDVHDFLLECTALDPRFGTLPLLEHSQREDVFLRIQRKVQQLHTQTSGSEKTKRRTGEASSPCRQLNSESELVSKKTSLQSLHGASFSAEPEWSTGSEQIRKEVELYRSKACVPLSSCPLKWWKDNCPQYPSMSPLAKAYLSIPVSSVPCQRVFSAAGDSLNTQRSRLLPEHLDMLLFLNQNLGV